MPLMVVRMRVSHSVSPRVLRTIVLCGAVVLPACGEIDSRSTSPGAFDYLSRCGSFGPALTGISFEGSGTDGPIRLAVSQQVRVSATVGRPEDVGLPSTECPSQTGGRAFFPRVQWSIPADGPIDVRLISCPCTVEYERIDSTGERSVVARTDGPGIFVFELVGRRPGNAYIGLAGYVIAPCAGRTPDEKLECGPYASDSKSVIVRPAD